MRRLIGRLQAGNRVIVTSFALAVGVGIGTVLGGALLIALMPQSTAANRDGSDSDSDTIHACVSVYTGQARLMLPGHQPDCSTHEVLVELAGPDAIPDVSALVARLDALETDHAALEARVPDCLSEVSGDAYFEGCNVQIVNGEGATDTINGSGNLIVGYNEDFLNVEARGGSHNVVIGPDHTYSYYGGFVAGFSNAVTGPYATVSGGGGNEASGLISSISGGESNSASGFASSVSGGSHNSAIGQASSVSGGDYGYARDSLDWIAGELFEDF